MQAAQVLNAGGLARVGPLTFVVKELTIDAEVGLRALLRSRARDAFGPGSFYANVLPVARWLREQGEHQDAAHLVASVAPMAAAKAGASEDAAEVWRQSPDGVALELFFRTRETHPDATQAEIRAVINEVNATETYIKILEAIAPKAAAGKTPSGSPSGS